MFERANMKKIASIAFATGAALALAACGSGEKATEEAQVENVEMPAEEAMGTVDSGATPVADASASVGAAASDEASDAAAAAAEKATADAEKAM